MSVTAAVIVIRKKWVQSAIDHQMKTMAKIKTAYRDKTNQYMLITQTNGAQNVRHAPAKCPDEPDGFVGAHCVDNDKRESECSGRVAEDGCCAERGTDRFSSKSMMHANPM